MKLYVRLGVVELACTFAAGFFLGRYLEKKVVVVMDENGVPQQPAKKKSVSYTDGKIVIDLKR